MLVSHFLLDLQEAHQRMVTWPATNDPSDISQSLSSRSVTFEHALGSLSVFTSPTDCDLQDGHQDGDYCVAPSENDHVRGEPTQALWIEDELEITQAGDNATDFGV